LLFNGRLAIFQLHHGKNKLHFDKMMTMPALYRTNTVRLIFNVEAY